MSKLSIPLFNTKQFFYRKESSCFVAEISDLPEGPFMGQVYDDACDMGFMMESERTGKKLLFLYDMSDWNDGEIAGWNFSYDDYENNVHFKALIIND